MFSRISEVGPNRQLVPSTPRLSFWTVWFRHYPWGHQVWDVGKYGTGKCGTGTQGRQIHGRRGRGMWIIIAKVGGKCDISHFRREYVLVKATHPALLGVPPCLFTKRRLGEDPLHWRKWNRSVLVFLLMEYWSPKQGLMGCGRQNSSRITAFDSK